MNSPGSTHWRKATRTLRPRRTQHPQHDLHFRRTRGQMPWDPGASFDQEAALSALWAPLAAWGSFAQAGRFPPVGVDGPKKLSCCSARCSSAHLTLVALALLVTAIAITIRRPDGERRPDLPKSREALHSLQPSILTMHHLVPPRYRHQLAPDNRTLPPYFDSCLHLPY